VDLVWDGGDEVT
jgi:hypothetical protein